MGMSSGGGESGGMVVGGPTPAAARLAGMLQSNAASEAARLAQESTNQAIQALNKQYQQARYDVKPYRTQGVQALNQLNQYLQLDPYNPGSAPELNLDKLKSGITTNQIRDYINQNSQLVSTSAFQPHTTKLADKDRYFSFKYTGAGSEDPNLLNQYQTAWTQGAGNPYYPGGIVSTAATALNPGIAPGQVGYSLASDVFGTDNNLTNAVRNYLAQQAYDQQLPEFQRNLEEYNQNKAWYDQYTAAGPLTQQQISDKISNLPGYQAQLEQGIDAIGKQASARGYLGSGRLLKELNQYGQNTLSTFYGNELNRLAQLAGAGQQAATQSGQYSAGLGQGMAGLYSNVGDTKANAALAGGNALAQALLAANQQYKIIGQQSSGDGGLGGIGSLLSGAGSLLGSGYFGKGFGG